MKIFDAIQQIEPCPRTKSTGCQCDRLDVISEAEETVKAIAQLEHTVGDVQGAVKFKQKPGQPTIIKGIVKGLTPGKHGFHIHEFGDLSDGCASAGGHYNPDGVDHGSLKQGHVGDLGNIVADKSGTARFQLKAERVELKDVVGRAIVIHADEDDLGKGGDEESLKTGNAGERVGCGVIRLREVVEENYSRKVSDKHFDRNQLPQIRRPDIQDSPFKYKEGKISIKVIKPVQTQRVPGLAKKSQNVFLQDIDRPFIVDKKGYLINGHHRYDAAHMLGMRTVPAIMIDADIEDVMNYFAHTRSNTEVVEHYFKKLYEKKLKEKDVVGMNPQAKKPYFTPDEADRANNEWINQAQVDQGDGVILNGTDGKQYRIMTSYGNQHFEDGEVYLDGVSDPNYIDTEGYPDAAELLYYHSATGHYPEELEEAKSSPGRVKRAGASCKGSVSELRRKAKKYSGEKGKMYHWCANMKSGRKKK
jgi:Cu/Zn superoxide dismutase